MSRDSYPAVESAHIVPRMYQRAWAVSGIVAVHGVGSDACRRLSTKRAGTRTTFYRRTRPTGEAIDDIEATLASVENRCAPVLKQVIEGAPLGTEAKGALAQFFGVQLMRGPAFFERREELLAPMVQDLEAGHFRPEVVAEAGGDVDVLKARLLNAALDPTERFRTMLQRAGKMAAVLGNMRWQRLQFGEPALAYSDHPVVVWPGTVARTAPPTRQQLGPLGALEVRVPISPRLAILMNWLDLPDADDGPLDLSYAGEINAFTIAQADTEWMHMIGHEPPVNMGDLPPLSRIFAADYSARDLQASQRRAHTARFLEKNKHRKWINNLEMLDLQPPVPAAP
jgi:hypothetical protein